MSFDYQEYHKEILGYFLNKIRIIKEAESEFNYTNFLKFIESANIDLFIENIRRDKQLNNNILEINAIINTVNNFGLIDEDINELYQKFLVRIRNFSKITEYEGLFSKELYKTFVVNNYYLNEEQKRVYELIGSEKMLFLSAPTSFGKSFLTRLAILGNDIKNIVILLPTNALVNEYCTFFKKHEKINLIQTSFDKSIDNRKNVTIMTYDRFSSIKQSSQYNYEWVVIDEFYNLDFAKSDSRGLFKHINSIFLRNPEVKMTILSPYTSNVKNLYARNFNSRFEFATEEIVKNELTSRDIVFINTNALNIEVLTKGKTWDFTTSNDLLEISNVDDWLPILKKVDIFSKNENIIIYSSDAMIFQIANRVASIVNEEINDERLNILLDYLKSVYGSNYPTLEYLKKGISIHAGFTDNIERKIVEKLFKLKVIKFIICTTTLIKGVNLNSRFLFIINQNKVPSFGNDIMDTRNLLGRIGRYDQDPHGFGFFINKQNVKAIKNNIEDENFTDVDSKNKSDNGAREGFIKFASNDASIEKNLPIFKNLENNEKSREIDYIHYIAPKIIKPTTDTVNEEILEIIEKYVNKDSVEFDDFKILYYFIKEHFDLGGSKTYYSINEPLILWQLFRGMSFDEMINSNNDENKSQFCINLVKFVNASSVIYNFKNAVRSYYKKFREVDNIIELFEQSTSGWVRYFAELGFNYNYLDKVKNENRWPDESEISVIKQKICDSKNKKMLLFKEVLDED